MKILWFEDFGGGLNEQLIAIEIFRNLIPIERFYSDYDPGIDISIELPRLFKKYTPHQIYICKSYLEWDNIYKQYKEDFDIAIIGINGSMFNTPQHRKPIDTHDFDRKVGFYIYFQLLKSGIKDENLAFFTGDADLLYAFMQTCKEILFDPPKYTFQKKSDDIEVLREWIEVKANLWTKQLSITGKGNYNVQEQNFHIAKPAIIFTEGKTDWQHLKNAQKKLNIILDIFYHEDIKEIGDSILLRDCEVYAKVFQQTPLIFIFDRDNPQIINKVSESDKGYKYWGNNVFSFAIPIPDHRRNYENISIEFYYTDNEIATEDLAGRRLFLTSEFDERSGNYKQNPIIHVGNQHKLRGVTKREKSKIVDSDIGVFNMEGQNIALSKAMFIENVGQDIFPFDKFEFEPFRKIFEMIEKILQNTDKDAERVGAADHKGRVGKLGGECQRLCRPPLDAADELG